MTIIVNDYFSTWEELKLASNILQHLKLSQDSMLFLNCLLLTNDLANAWLRVGVWIKQSFEIFFRKRNTQQVHHMHLCQYEPVTMCDWSLVLIPFLHGVFWLALKWTCLSNNHSELFFTNLKMLCLQIFLCVITYMRKGIWQRVFYGFLCMNLNESQRH